MLADATSTALVSMKEWVNGFASVTGTQVWELGSPFPIGCEVLHQIISELPGPAMKVWETKILTRPRALNAAVDPGSITWWASSAFLLLIMCWTGALENQATISNCWMGHIYPAATSEALLDSQLNPRSYERETLEKLWFHPLIKSRCPVGSSIGNLPHSVMLSQALCSPSGASSHQWLSLPILRPAIGWEFH